MVNRKQLLSFAVFFSLSCTIVSCGKTIIDYLVKSEYQYINATPHRIAIKVYASISGSVLDTYELLPGDTLILNATDQTHATETAPENYVPLLQGDSVQVAFSDTLCYKEYRGVTRILNNPHSYTYSRRGARDYVFYYTIDSTLLSLAQPCQ